MDLASGPFLVAVLDRFVLGVLIRHPFVSGPLVSVDSFCISGGVLSNEAVQGFPVGSTHYLKTDVAVALHGSYHDGLVALVAAPLTFYLATDKGLVNLNYAAQELGVYLVECIADS